MRQTPDNMRAFLMLLRNKMKLRSLVITLAAIVVFVTTYLLILPAFTLDKEEAAEQGGIDVVAIETAAAGENDTDNTDNTSSAEEAGEHAAEKAVKETDPEASPQPDPKKTDKHDEVRLLAKETTISADKASGDSFAVSAVIGKDAKVPEDVILTATELDKNTEGFEFDQYKSEALNALKKDSKDVKGIRSIKFYDISLESDTQDESVEPSAPVSVKIEYDEGMKVSDADNIRIVHFAVQENGEVKPVILDTIENKVETTTTANGSKVTGASFDTDGFSTFAVVEVETIEDTFITADGKTYNVIVSYGGDAGIPENAKLQVNEVTEADQQYGSYVEQAAALIESNSDALSYIKVLDISIVDESGDKVEPDAQVDVQIRLMDTGHNEQELQVVHFAEDAKTNSVEPELLENTVEGDTVKFSTSGFSAYAIVQGPAAIEPGWEKAASLTDLTRMSSDGLYISNSDNLYLTNKTTDHTSIEGLSGIQGSSSTRAYPTDDAAKYYFEAVPGQTNQFYIYCFDDENNKRYATYDTAAEEGPYSIILTANNDEKTPCTLSYTGGYWRIRFNNNADLRWNTHDNIFDGQNKDTNFNIYHYIGTENDTYKLDGKTYGLMYWVYGVTGKGLLSSENETAGNLNALPLTVMSKKNNGSKLYVPDDSDISFWTFHFIEADLYQITTVVDGSTKYLRLTNSGIELVSTPDDNCKISVIPGTGSNAGKLCLKSGNATLAYSGNIENGFKIGGTAGTEWLNLVEESELTNDYFMTYSASKVSVSDESVTNGSRVIVYTRVWNDTDKKYEFYAIDHDGSLVRCYESGDSIEWVGGRLNSMLWSFYEYYWEGTTDPNYYYDLYNQYSESYIAPQKSNGQTLSDAAIGINLNGRRNERYYTPIIAWDDGYYAYAGLKADMETGKIVSCPLAEADDFYFAIVQDIPVDDELTTVPTVDHTQYGITMKMVNFGTDLYVGSNNDNVRRPMSNFLGSDNQYKNGNTEPGLLQTKLGDDGYPVSKEGNSLSTWFADRPEVNHLFIQSTYSGTGYFEYDSVQNFAHLDQTKNEFVVYKELGGSATTGQFHDHGHFWPYNDIEAGKFRDNRNIRTALGGNMPETDPRKYEKLYAIQKSNTNYAPDYYMGMEVTATFTQTPNGLDDWGHDIIYEFTGDDDFWLFVDGELIIDLGGIHDALAGNVNYRTGIVNVNGRQTTLKELFKSNYETRNPDASEEDVAAYLDGIFTEEGIFKDYTTHTMRIYYLERGAGASNLHMRFNLASIKPGTAQLSKRLSGVETSETVLAEFPYQIIYRTKTGDDEPVEHYLTNYVPGDSERMYNHVFYKDSAAPCTYKKSYTIARKTYNDVFILKPDETVDINFPTEEFPEGTELLDYRIIECGLNTDVYTAVMVNDIPVQGTDVVIDGDTVVEGRKDYGIEYATTEERARVVYDNAVNPEAIKNLTIKKRVFDVTGETEITDVEDDSTFDFRLYLATESGDVNNTPANMHTYHVKDPEGNYCYWSVEQQRIVPLGDDKSSFTELSPEEVESATFHTSMNGSITKIPVGHTVEIRDLLVGTKFKLVERPGEIPDGYSFLKYIYLNEQYTSAADGVTDVIDTGEDPYLEVHNIKGFGLRVNKTWTDADFMAEREPVYFGIFYKGSNNEMLLVDGSLRQMAYGTSTIYWYYDRLPVEGLSDFGEYIIYEVSLEDPVVDSAGIVTSYSGMTRIDAGGTIDLSGKQLGDTVSSSFSYTVSYERGQTSSNNNVRVDEVMNSRPGIILRKTKWDGSTSLEGANFTLVDEDNYNLGTYTSDENGLITEAYLREGVDYYLTETSSPQSYHGLEAPMVIKLDDGSPSISGVDVSYYTISTEENHTVITVKNRPYQLKVIKMDKGSNAPLANVRFSLYREIVVDGVHSWDPNPYPGYEQVTSGANGIIPGIDNTLPPGKYQLRETRALSGYQTLSGHIVFTVTATGAVEFGENEPKEATFEEPEVLEDGSILYTITVTNSKEFNVSIWKTDVGYNAITTGSIFNLYHAEDYDDIAGQPIPGAVPIIRSGVTGSNGILSLGKLSVGEYRLVETMAPDGYNLPSEAIKIFVTNNGVTATQSGAQSEVYVRGDQYWVTGQDNSTRQIRVWNNPGVELPMTGGTGTTIFYIIGSLLVIVCGIVLVARRRARRD